MLSYQRFKVLGLGGNIEMNDSKLKQNAILA
jgi:hypothetical protein